MVLATAFTAILVAELTYGVWQNLVGWCHCGLFGGAGRS